MYKGDCGEYDEKNVGGNDLYGEEDLYEEDHLEENAERQYGNHQLSSTTPTNSICYPFGLKIILPGMASLL